MFSLLASSILFQYILYNLPTTTYFTYPEFFIALYTIV